MCADFELGKQHSQAALSYSCAACEALGSSMQRIAYAAEVSEGLQVVRLQPDHPQTAAAWLPEQPLQSWPPEQH